MIQTPYSASTAPDKRVGSAPKKRRYDLPLHEDAGTSHVMALVGLMAFLSVVILSFSFTLQHMMRGWSEGLENKVTIQMPVQTQDGTTRDAEQLKMLSQSIIEKMEQTSAVQSIDIVEQTKMQALMREWLGDSQFIADIPMPVLLSVQFDGSASDIQAALLKIVHAIDPSATLETHESWLKELFKLTSALQAVVIFIVLAIGFTTICAVAGAIKAQIAIHRDDVELLHLIGAQDDYIVSQFQRHAGLLALKGSVIGVVGAMFILGFAMLLLRDSLQSFLPDTQLTGGQIIQVLLIPGVICGICAISARYSVLQVLRKMP